MYSASLCYVRFPVKALQNLEDLTILFKVLRNTAKILSYILSDTGFTFKKNKKGNIQIIEKEINQFDLNSLMNKFIFFFWYFIKNKKSKKMTVFDNQDTCQSYSEVYDIKEDGLKCDIFDDNGPKFFRLFVSSLKFSSIRKVIDFRYGRYEKSIETENSEKYFNVLQLLADIIEVYSNIFYYQDKKIYNIRFDICRDEDGFLHLDGVKTYPEIKKPKISRKDIYNLVRDVCDIIISDEEIVGSFDPCGENFEFSYREI